MGVGDWVLYNFCVFTEGIFALGCGFVPLDFGAAGGGGFGRLGASSFIDESFLVAILRRCRAGLHGTIVDAIAPRVRRAR